MTTQGGRYMPVYLLLAAVVMLSCIVLNKLTSKLGIPMLLAFILLGMFFGSDGVVQIQFSNYSFAEQICSLALIFIMFYGGFGTSWDAAKPVAVKSILLSSLGVILTAALTGLFCRFVMNMPWLESFLMGSVISSTDAASVFSVLRSKRLNLKYHTASLLEVESGSNDPCSYMLTVIFLAIMNGTASTGQIAYMIFAQLVYGAVFGVLIAIAAIWLLKKFRFSASGFDTIFVVAVVLLAYAAPAALGGNGYLSVYIAGLMMGNAEIKNKRALVHFFDGVTGITQMLVFFLLGLLSAPSQLILVMLPALIIALFLTFVARPAAIFAILSPFKSNIRQQLTVSWAGLRGAASIVFAIMVVMGAKTENDIFHIVFCIVLFSILIQGSLIPFVARRLNMIDDQGDVMKTFTDYTDEVPVQFIQFTIANGHAWCNKQIYELTLPPDTILALLERDGQRIVPNGGTVILDGDKLVLCARSPEDVSGVKLGERHVKKGSELIGLPLSKLKNTSGALIVMVQRGQQIIIPNGDTVLLEGDILVLNHIDS